MSVEQLMKKIQMMVLEKKIHMMVVEPFESGLTSFLKLIETIDKAEESIDERSTLRLSENLLGFANEMASNFERAKTAAANAESDISSRLEQHKSEQRQIEKDLHKIEECLNKLKYDSIRLEKEAYDAQQELDRERRRLTEAQDTLAEAEKTLKEKKDFQENVAIAAVPAYFIPVVGLMAASTMVVLSLTALQKDVESATDLRNIANDSCRQKQTELDNKRTELDRIRNEIDKKKHENSSKERDRDQLRQDIAREEMLYRDVSKLSEGLRETLAMISLTKGRSQVLRDEIKNMYSLVQLERPFNELSQLLHSSEQSKCVCQLLSDRTMTTRLTDKLKALSYRLENPLTALVSKCQLQSKEMSAVRSSVTSDSLVRKKVDVLVEQHTGWENYLIPIPGAMASIGKLCLLASRKDFPIGMNCSPRQFKNLKYPESFRTSVLQISNSFWVCCNEIQTNMDQIRMHVSSLPRHMACALSELENTADRWKLKRILEGIKGIVSTILDISESSQKQIQDVEILLDEFQEACVGAGGLQQTERDKIKAKLQSAKQQKKNLEEQAHLAASDNEKNIEALLKAEEALAKAIKSSPSSAKVAIQGLIDGFKSTKDAVSSFFERSKDQSSGQKKRTYENETEEEEDIDEGQLNTYEEAYRLSCIFNTLNDTFISVDNKLKESLREEHREELRKQEATLCDVETQLSQLNISPLSSQLQILCKQGHEVCNALHGFMGMSSNHQQSDSSLKADLIKLKEEAFEIDNKGKELKSRFENKKRIFRGQHRAEGSSTASTLENDFAEIKFQASQLRKQVKFYEDKQKEIQNKQKQLQKRINDYSCTISSALLEANSIGEVIGILLQGTRCLADIKTQWSELTKFVNKLANITQSSLGECTGEFLQYASPLSSISQTRKELLVPKVKKSSELAQVVFLLTECYCEVSYQHIMPRVGALPCLLCEEFSSNAARENKLREIEKACEASQKAIEESIEAKMSCFASTVAERITALQQLILTLPNQADDEVEDDVWS